jgi:signal transduction histidine kinase
VVLEIADRGVGFDPAEARGRGIGLQSLAGRAARLGGELQLESTPGKGTAIRLSVPVGTGAGRRPALNSRG